MKSKLKIKIFIFSTFFLLLVSQGRANDYAFTSEDVATIESQNVATGMTFVLNFRDKTARCRAHSLAEMPGWKCVFEYKNSRSLSLRKTDVALVLERLASRASGQGTPVQIDGQNLFCKNNSFAEEPGYKCYF